MQGAWLLRANHWSSELIWKHEPYGRQGAPSGSKHGDVPLWFVVLVLKEFILSHLSRLASWEEGPSAVSTGLNCGHVCGGIFWVASWWRKTQATVGSVISRRVGLHCVQIRAWSKTVSRHGLSFSSCLQVSAFVSWWWTLKYKMK